MKNIHYSKGSCINGINGTKPIALETLKNGFLSEKYISKLRDYNARFEMK